MYASTILLAVPVLIGRFFIVQSPLWLMFRGRVEEAQAATERLLRRDPPYPKEVVLQHPEARDSHHADKAPWSGLFHGTNLHRTILASVPWFLQDLGTYGIGIFTPTILATLIGASIAHPRNLAELIQSDILATEGAAFIDAVDRGNRVCRVARRPRGPHPPSSPRLHRLRGRLAVGGAVAPRRRDAVRRAALCRLHAV